MSDRSCGRWHRRILVASLVSAACGIVLAVFPFAAPVAARNAAIAGIFFDGTWPPYAAASDAFSPGALGGTIGGFHALHAFVTAVPFNPRERWARHAIVSCTLVWLVVDSAVSLCHGAAFHV